MRMMEEIKRASEQTRSEVFGFGDFSETDTEMSSVTTSGNPSRRSSLSDEYPSSWDECPSPHLENTFDSLTSDRIGEYYVNPYVIPAKLQSDFGSTVTLCPTIVEEESSVEVESEEPRRKVCD